MPTIKDLKDESRYTKLDEVSQDNIVDFVKKYLFQRVSNLTVAFNSAFVFVIFMLITASMYFKVSWSGLIIAFLAAVISIIAYIPIHELIHGMVYRRFGAKDVRYHANWKKLLFSTTAHGFVIGGKDFAIVAAAPFLALTVICLLLALFGGGFTIFALLLFLMNLIVSGGDIALINYVYHRKKFEVFTYDDDDKKMTYFYRKGCVKEEEATEEKKVDMVAELKAIAAGKPVKVAEPVETKTTADAEGTTETETK